LTNYDARFYKPNRDYRNLIFAIPGNHDGEILSPTDNTTLEAYLANFCQPTPGVIDGRPMPNQPGAYWRLTSPFVDIIGLYSNTDEDVGALGDAQKSWLKATLLDIAAERAGGSKQALVIAVHHPPYARGLVATGPGHPGNPVMLGDFDDCCSGAGVWPDAVLSGHVHNYQRYMRTKTIGSATRTIPYLISGGGGKDLVDIGPIGITSPSGDVTFANALKSFRYLTVTVSATQLTVAFTTSDCVLFETFTVALP
jgi:hypothetical protein